MPDQDGSPGRKRPPFRRLPGDQRREEIIDAAIELFGRRIETEVSVDDIAAAAGTSRSSLYRHFDDKGELYLASMRKLADELLQRLASVPGGSPSEQLADRISTYFDFLEEYGVGYGDMLKMAAHVGYSEAIHLVQEMRDHVYRLTYRTLRLDSPSRPLELALHAWVAGMEWTAMEWLRDRDPSRAQVETLLQGQFFAMVIGVAAYDPPTAAVLHRVIDEEPPGGPAAGFVHQLGGLLSLRAVGSVARLLSGDPAPGAGELPRLTGP